MEYNEAIPYIGKMVKSWGKDCQQHGTPAILVGIKNKTTAIIKPCGHKREEMSPLSKIMKWESRNQQEEIKIEKPVIMDDFYNNIIDIDKAIEWCSSNYFPIVRIKHNNTTTKCKLFRCNTNSVSVILEDKTIINNIKTLSFYQEDQKMQDSIKLIEEFVIVNPVTKMFWSGKNKWVKEIIKIVKYNNQYGRSAYTKVLKHTPSAKLINFNTIHSLIDNWNNIQPIEPQCKQKKSEQQPKPEQQSDKPNIESELNQKDKLKTELEQAYQDKLIATEMINEIQIRIDRILHKINVLNISKL
jgi:hypothetical protein